MNLLLNQVNDVDNYIQVNRLFFYHFHQLQKDGLSDDLAKGGSQ
jgi:hypothetical protein